MKKSLLKTLLLSLVSLLSAVGAYAQVTITGNVTDESGEPVIGAYITLESDKSVGTITDFDGNYELSVPANSNLIFTYTGYEDQVINTSGKSSVNVVLKESTSVLEEVVAVGYGSQKAKEITSSVASVKSENFNTGVKGSPVGLIQGKVAGLTITNTAGGDPTSTGLNVQIRGTSTLDAGAGSTPLYIVDGVPVSNIDNIAPDDIASMDVLKDGSSAAIYGTRGTNGVILITTKRGSSSESTDCGTTTFEYSGYVSMAHQTGSNGMTTVKEYATMSDWTNGKFTGLSHGSYNDYAAM
ncbi:MAG: TonB-dependent receptor plug domain-containing protein, partial [Paludibacteraceae bacterium]|nr:TonB-dependent receptor plug domain-containing protein [Paludibacteraceae bacterium]